jgi:hypothetical protein
MRYFLRQSSYAKGSQIFSGFWKTAAFSSAKYWQTPWQTDLAKTASGEVKAVAPLGSWPPLRGGKFNEL